MLRAASAAIITAEAEIHQGLPSSGVFVSEGISRGFLISVRNSCCRVYVRPSASWYCNVIVPSVFPYFSWLSVDVPLPAASIVQFPM